jgi:hypothetical protein
MISFPSFSERRLSVAENLRADVVDALSYLSLPSVCLTVSLGDN